MFPDQKSKKSIEVSVLNVENDFCHLRRVTELPADVIYPFDDIQRSLNYLFYPLKIKVLFDIQYF